MRKALNLDDVPWHVVFSILLVVLALASYAKTLNVGYLLDDYSHVDDVYQAFHGNPTALLNSFRGNWTGTADGLTSYRPALTLGFCLDYIFWKLHSEGKHLTNLIEFSFCCLLVSWITVEATTFLSKFQSRLTGFFAGLLFTVYPLHPETVAWISGRSDGQCAVFYLASIYAYFRFRRTSKKVAYVLALLMLAIALPTKEMAVTLPPVLLVSEFLLGAKGGLDWFAASKKQRALFILPFWLFLIVFSAIRTWALGTVVGGYGQFTFKLFKDQLRNFLDKGSILKTIFGANEELTFADWLKPAVYGCFGLAGALSLLRFAEYKAYWRTLLFLLCWIVIALLPTFQVFHIYPNLVGSRLVYVSSAPSAMAMAILLVPPLFSINNSMVRMSLQAASIGCLSGLAICWWLILSNNLMPWIEAGRQMSGLVEQVRSLTQSVADDKNVLLLDLPQDYKGAGMLGRPDFLKVILRPPMASVDTSAKALSDERPIPGSNEFLYPRQFLKLVDDGSVASVVRWSRDTARFEPWHKPGGDANLDVANSPLPLRIEGAHPPGDIWLAPLNLNPLAVAAVELQLKPGTDASSLSLSERQRKELLNTVAPRVQLLWRCEKTPKTWIDYSEGPCAQVVNNKLVFVPSRYRVWELNGSVKQLGLRFVPGNYSVTATALRGISEQTVMPTAELKLKTPSNVHDIWMARTTAGPVSVDYDGSSVPGCTKLMLLISKSGVAFSDTSQVGLPPALFCEAKIELPQTRGTVSLPETVSGKPGIRQIMLVALDKSGSPIGFGSEPRTLAVTAAADN